MNNSALKALFVFFRLVFSTGIFILAVFLITKASSYFYDYTHEIAAQIPGDERSSREVVVAIPDGASTVEIAEILQSHGLITNVTWFRIQSKLYSNDGLYKSGTYNFNTNMDDEDLMELLVKGTMDEAQITITIPEGYTADQIASYLQEKGICKADEFIAAMNQGSYDYDFLLDIPERNKKLEGYLFPDTYFIREDATAEEIISKMLLRFEQVYTEELQEKARYLGLKMDDVITMASIVEAEIKVPDERPKAAAVIYNRLESDMRLEMCSTIMYALGKRKDKLLLTDLEIDSPYNTYRHEGLPLGPIGNPGSAAINAVLNPGYEDYLFFVVKDEETGEHEFTNSYDEFLAAKARYNQKF